MRVKLYEEMIMIVDKNRFILEKSAYGQGTYLTEYNRFKIEIAERDFSDEKVLFSEKLIAIYPSKVSELAKFCVESACFKACYPNETVDTIMVKLHLPSIQIDDSGGIFTYCNHEFDEVHLIEVEFVGLMDCYCAVTIDG